MNRIRLVGVVLLVGMLAACGSTKDGSTAGAKAATSSSDVTTSVAPTTTQTPKPTTPKPTTPPETAGQSNARRSATSYLSMGSGFSRAGLIEQLSSDAGEGFSVADATYGVDAGHTDWNAEACVSAKSYLQMDAFSHAGLVEQLSSQAGEGFSPAEAEHGVTCAGL